MKIEEAVQKLKRLELQDFGKKRKFELKESEVDYITVSNELDKYRDIIDELINEVTIKDAELDKKDKQIEEAYKEGFKKGALPQVLEKWNNEQARIVKVNKIEDKKDRVIDMMAEYIEELTGSCPNDIYDWKEIDCENVCNDPMKQCWIKYFYKKIEKIN